MADRRKLLISTRGWATATSLFVAHFTLWAYVVWRGILYDQGGFEGLLWWIVAFWILPVVGLLTLAVSLLTSLLGWDSLEE